MTETLTLHVTNKTSVRFREAGDYMLLKDAAELPRSKDDLNAWNRRLSNSHQHTCEYTGQVSIYVPAYTFQQDTCTEEGETRKKEITADSVIPKAKAQPREPKAPSEVRRSRISPTAAGGAPQMRATRGGDRPRVGGCSARWRTPPPSAHFGPAAAR